MEVDKQAVFFFAIDKAVKDDMDVINLSLGASINDPLYPTSVAVNNAMLAGVVTVVAAGNSGREKVPLDHLVRRHFQLQLEPVTPQ